jgi:GDPmannose 4,6-dehydratase
MSGPEFVTRKITIAVSKISKGLQEFLELGNLDAKRDWGYAKDYVEGMWRILQHNKADDFVLSTNETHSVKEFVELSFKFAGIEIEWEGTGINEIGKDAKTGKILVKVNPAFFRPAEVDILIGDYSKAKSKLEWEPKTRFEDLVKIMIEKDLERISNTSF